MKRITIKLSIAALTFSLGLTAAWLMHNLLGAKEALHSKPHVLSAAVPENARSKFKPAMRACGAGYAQFYELPDGQTMVEGSYWFVSSAKAASELKGMLSKAASIVERVPNCQNRFGDSGERIVALFPPDKKEQGVARIYWYGGGQSFLYVEAPSLEIALEFERANAYAF